ncbi:MAG: SDR family oxidoreductase [Desulfobacterales bacterium]|jgi:NAD(P)-dependent dehydrogenase (short-subunit alcohol dehydrogenase family)|nr:SDR family oxidoreductase [Desulfobacterales bacterium]
MDRRSVLVVGGSSGIGLEIVKGLALQGDETYVGSRTTEKLAGVEKVHHLAFDVQELPDQLQGLPDVLNALVYCPGTIRLKPFQRLTREEFLEDWQINFLGAARTIQACLPHLKKAPAGASIVLFSTVAVACGMPFHASIAGAKGAVEGLTRSLAAELAPRIRVNAIAPSLTDTPLAADLLAGDEKRKAAAERHPLKRIGSAQEIARLALFLLSDDAAWISGQILHADGGMGTLKTFK